MVKDRLPDLHARIGKPLDTAIPFNDEADVQSPLLATELENGQNEENIFKLLNDLGLIYADIKEINEEIRTLRVILNQNRREKFEDQVQAVKRSLHGVRKGMEQLNVDHQNTLDGLLRHVLNTHLLSMRVLSSEALSQLSNLMVNAHDRHKEYIKKELLITCGYDKSLSDEELDNLMQKPAAVFTQDLLQETNLAKQTLTELRERHDQFLKLEGNIVELNQLFVDLALMVRTQGESVDLVERNIYEASAKTTEAKEQMEEAKKQAHSARKKKMCLILIGAIVIIVLLILIILSLL